MAANVLSSWSQFHIRVEPPVLRDEVDSAAPVPMSTPEVYASIEQTLALVAGEHRQAPWGSEVPLLHAPADERPAPASPGGAFSASWLVVALALATGLLLWWLRQPAAEPAGSALRADAQAPAQAVVPAPVPPAALAQPAAPAPTIAQTPAPPSAIVPAPPPPPAVPVPAVLLPKLEILTDAENTTGARIAADIARLFADGDGFDIVNVPTRNWAAGLRGAHDALRLAVAPYDALQDARKGGVGPLRVVMPLYAEEVHFIVRADSPLRFIHQIEGRSINIGPATGNGALTASTIYERMFGAPMPLAPAAFVAQDEALTRLLAGSIDVLVAVDAQPAAWLQALDAGTARSLRLLALDPAAPASRRALQTFLPASVAPDSYQGWLTQPVPTLAVMSFLVTAERDDAASAERLARFAQSLCRNLPALRSSGHAKWREVQPGLQLDAGWPYSQAAAEAFRACSRNPPSDQGASR